MTSSYQPPSTTYRVDFEKLAEAIKKEKGLQGLSDSYLADQFGLSQATVSSFLGRRTETVSAHTFVTMVKWLGGGMGPYITKVRKTKKTVESSELRRIRNLNAALEANGFEVPAGQDPIAFVIGLLGSVSDADA